MVFEDINAPSKFQDAATNAPTNRGRKCTVKFQDAGTNAATEIENIDVPSITRTCQQISPTEIEDLNAPSPGRADKCAY